jgi:DNA repair protein RecN (Recombination protein N)
MLEELIVKDYALIERLSVSFDSGLNILSGETGAGKSIIVGAVSFLLGAKVDVDIIRTGSEETSVSAVLRYDPQNQEVYNWLSVKDIQADEGRLIVRRNLKRSGRGSAYIQEVPVTLNDLREFTSFLFDIHGQHDHQSLLRKETHRKYLDRFAGIENLVQEFNTLFLILSERRKDLEASLESERDRNKRLELLAYSVEEIKKVNPKSGESQELENEATRLGDFEKLSTHINNAVSAIMEAEPSVLALLRKTRTSLESAVPMDNHLEPLTNRLNDLYYEIEDLAEQVRMYRDNLRYDPGRLEELEERLALLYRLKKKYGEDEDAILTYCKEAEQEIESLNHLEEDREKLKADIENLERDIMERSGEIRKRRSAAAEILASQITDILHSLGMPKAKFTVKVIPKGLGPRGFICGPWGSEDVEFLISPNMGEPEKELIKIASGGELSRVMLAIKTVLAHSDTVETLIFDEIDTGIGGEVALAVGEHLAKIGALKQIFCITHLASIAVRADNHLKVDKYVEGERTVTTVKPIPQEERRREIARMLAGDSAGSAALAHAEELLSKYGSGN